MNPELETLDALSARFEAMVDSLPRSSAGRGALLLAPDNPLPGEGEQILEYYDALYAQAPEDVRVRGALAQHLFRLGSLYDQAVEVRLLEDGSGVGEAVRTAWHAQQASRYLGRSYQLLPGPYAAMAMGDLFRSVGFHGTALAWYGRAERAGGDAQTVAEAVRQGRALRAQGRTADSAAVARQPLPH